MKKWFLLMLYFIASNIHASLTLKECLTAGAISLSTPVICFAYNLYCEKPKEQLQEEIGVIDEKIRDFENQKNALEELQKQENLSLDDKFKEKIYKIIGTCGYHYKPKEELERLKKNRFSTNEALYDLVFSGKKSIFNHYIPKRLSYLEGRKLYLEDKTGPWHRKFLIRLKDLYSDPYQDHDLSCQFCWLFTGITTGLGLLWLESRLNKRSH